MKVNINGVWKDSKPYVNINNEWKPCTAGYVKINGEWKQFFSAGKEIIITESRNNINLLTELKGVPEETDITVIIPAGVIICSDSSNKPAFIIPAELKNKNITLINKGAIIGKGGSGGGGASRKNWGGAGAKGGVALSVQAKTSLQNSGFIYGGGGGGGGGGGAYAENSWTYGGSGGSGAGPSEVGLQGNPGVYRYGSTGGPGGKGGDFGEPGNNGGYGHSSAGYYVGGGGVGGQAGEAIDGYSNIKIQELGSVKGKMIN